MLIARRTQLSLEKEIARREFEQTWLQEERQLSQAVQARARERHASVRQDLESQLVDLRRKYQRKIKRMGERRHYGYHPQTSSSSSHLLGDSSSSVNNAIHYFGDLEEEGGIRQGLPLELLGLQDIPQQESMDSEEGSASSSSSSGASSSTSGDEDASDSSSSNEGELTVTSGAAAGRNAYFGSSSSHLLMSGDDLVEERTSALAAASNELDLMDESTRPLLLLGSTRIDSSDTQSLQSQDASTTTALTTNTPVLGAIILPLPSSSHNDECPASPTRSQRPGAIGSAVSPRARRASRLIQKDTIFYPEEANGSTTAILPATTTSPRPRSSRSLLKDEIFLPEVMPVADTDDTIQVLARPKSKKSVYKTLYSMSFLLIIDRGKIFRYA